MYDVMEGVRVVEVAEHTFAPAAGMILADWGADVVKVERANGGDPARHMKIPGTGGDRSPYFEAANRGKRSIGLDLDSEDGRDALHRLIDTADVFITNLRGHARKRLGIEADLLIARNPRLIYARATGNGMHGPLADAGGFDFPTAWCRAGSAYMQSGTHGEPPIQPASIGDLTGGATLAGAVAAALFRRERTGKGAVIDNALYLVGSYLMSQTLIAASLGNPLPKVAPQRDAYNALLNLYRTRDGRWISLCLLLDKWWPDFARHIGRADLIDDARFVDPPSRARNVRALVDILNREFAERDYAEWCDRLEGVEGVWAPVQSPAEVIEDRQALDNGFVTPVAGAAGTGPDYVTGASPAQFDERPIGPLRASPAFAADGDAILAEIGFASDRIKALRTHGVLV